MTMLNIQKTLKSKGYDPGPLDGIGGPSTGSAFEAALADMGFNVSVRASRGSMTLTPVQRVAKPKTELPWMDEAMAVMGLHERDDNAKLRSWLKSDGGTVGDPSRNPWCGDYVHTAIRLGLPEEKLPSRIVANPYLALNWIELGFQCKPSPGAILVFWRKSPSSIYGHVGFYWGEDANHYYVIGGNQKNEVSLSKIAKNRLRPGGCRWPTSAKVSPSGPVYMDDDDVLVTVNEA